MMWMSCNCRGVLGFDRTAWPGPTGCDPSLSVVENIKDDISKLSGLKVVFAGHVPGACTNAIYFAAGDWEAVRLYIVGGGRLWLNLEYYPCLQDGPNVANFLTALGSGMGWGATSEIDLWNPTAAKIAVGATFQTGNSSRITGGTPLFTNAAGSACVAVEQLGNGFLFVCGDSEAITNGTYTSCTFVRRIWENADNNII